MNTLRKKREAILAFIVVAIILLVAVRAPEYLAGNNIANILSNWGFLVILVMGQLCVLLTRGIDLSQASVLAFSGMFLALLSQAMPALPSALYIALAILMGTALGMINGILVALIGIPAIIATLGTMTIIRGLIYVLSSGVWISSHEMSGPFKSFPASALLGVPTVFLVAVVVTLVFWMLLDHRRTGRDIYAYGGNPDAARNAGVSRVRIEILVYALSGAAAGLCGYLWAGRYAIAYTQAAEGREFAIIAACVIGGVSITGGRGTVLGACLGALFIAIVETALPFLRINPFLQLAVIGAVILIAVAANARAERRPGRQILPRTMPSAGTSS
ncbi:MAG: ABC transporter permease [Stappiaceae bacterium]